MKQKLFTYVAFSGLFIVLLGIVSRHLSPVASNYRSGMFIVGFSLMLLGTIWRVVTEMNEKDQ
ncbi:hypothetical protein [Roseivirga thermotolerans]|uniref:hypothetical protein n=1 Tax=Roseivirga thermotolerans TaxID=1758176 RepID=UPI00167A6DA8|nr:hypothetical protein [Roseivirga thermotolerans]